MEWLLSSRRSQAYLLRFTKVTWLRVVAIWNHIGKSLVQPLFSLSGSLFFSGSAFLVFCLPSISPFAFFFCLSFLCYHSMTGAWMSLCVGAHGWVAGIASHRSVLLSRGWLVTVETSGHPGHSPSTQLDAVVKCLNAFCSLSILLFIVFNFILYLLQC